MGTVTDFVTIVLYILSSQTLVWHVVHIPFERISLKREKRDFMLNKETKTTIQPQEKRRKVIARKSQHVLISATTFTSLHWLCLALEENVQNI
jgi:hypothetical protein